MTTWRPDRLLRAVLAWTAFTTIVLWLPFVRGAMDGSSYVWGLGGLGGRGLSGDYWALAIAVPLALATLYLGWRGARWPFHALILLWNLPLGGLATYAALTSPERMRFRGDTLGIDISLAWVGPVLFGGFALLALLWVVRDLRSGRERVAPAWTRANKVRFGLALSILPVQFALLRVGEPHGATDAAGVILTIVQWFAINSAMVPREEPAPAAAPATEPETSLT